MTLVAGRYLFAPVKRARTAPGGVPPRRVTLAIDLAILTPHGRQLAVLLRRGAARGRDRWVVPTGSIAAGETLEGGAERLARGALGALPGWLAQIAAISDGRRHPLEADLSVAFAAAVPLGTPAPVGGEHAWFSTDALPMLAARQRASVDSAVQALRMRMDQEPVAFRLLPSAFTLSELQTVYEVLLGRRLHKASFRRALHAAGVVEATDEWRSEGRGRPAQLFRYSPRRRRAGHRTLRFELLSAG